MKTLNYTFLLYFLAIDVLLLELSSSTLSGFLAGQSVISVMRFVRSKSQTDSFTFLHQNSSWRKQQTLLRLRQLHCWGLYYCLQLNMDNERTWLQRTILGVGAVGKRIVALC